MTGRKMTRVPSSGLRWLVVVLLILGAAVLRFADVPFAVRTRETVKSVFSGEMRWRDALAAIGAEQTPSAPAFQPATTEAPAIVASSGGADDLLGREETLFPDRVDETVYPMEFAHQVPTQGSVTSVFGSRLSPLTGQPGFHYGIDVAAQEGEVIGAFADGTVREVGESSYGKYLIVDHKDGFSTLYAHCSSISAKVGDAVQCGQEIARVGQTGNATGPHLHLELWRDGAALDPECYLTEL